MLCRPALSQDLVVRTQGEFGHFVGSFVGRPQSGWCGRLECSGFGFDFGGFSSDSRDLFCRRVSNRAHSELWLEVVHSFFNISVASHSPGWLAVGGPLLVWFRVKEGGPRVVAYPFCWYCEDWTVGREGCIRSVFAWTTSHSLRLKRGVLLCPR